MTKTHFKRKLLFLCPYCVIILQCYTTLVVSDECKKLSSCSCDCDGNIIDLKDLANKAGGVPRYKNYAAKNPDDPNLYSYNPCEPFTETVPGTLEDHCLQVAGCQIVNFGGLQFYDLGTQESVQFSTGSYKGDDVIIARYESVDKVRHTNVILQCKGGETSFEAYGEDSDNLTDFRFILRSPHCCFDSSGLSVGSVLIIICVVLLIVYVIFGVVYNAVHNKASGSALFTHVIVWKALPGLVKELDEIVNAISGVVMPGHSPLMTSQYCKSSPGQII